MIIKNGIPAFSTSDLDTLKFKSTSSYEKNKCIREDLNSYSLPLDVFYICAICIVTFSTMMGAYDLTVNIIPVILTLLMAISVMTYVTHKHFKKVVESGNFLKSEFKVEELLPVITEKSSLLTSKKFYPVSVSSDEHKILYTIYVSKKIYEKLEVGNNFFYYSYVIGDERYGYLYNVENLKN